MNIELVLIPCAFKGHLTPALEFAKLLVTRNQRLSITVLLIKYPLDHNLAAYADSLASSFASERIKFVDITRCADPSDASETDPVAFVERFVVSHKPRVRTAVVSADGSPRAGLVGFILDMACMSLSDVAIDLGIPNYVFWIMGATFLSLQIHLQRNPEILESIDVEAVDLSFPGIAHPVPARVLPSSLFDSSATILLRTAKKVSESSGIVVNTSAEIEPHALKALSSKSGIDTPPVYAVGPVLSLLESCVHEAGKAFSEPSAAAEEIAIPWLDDQPPGSVLFLCFGSVMGFVKDQIREIAKAIEYAGVRFLWTLRQNSADGKMAFASDNCADLDSVLPEGFLERTAGRGRVIGWAPQAAVLAHPAVGGFVSHCGWNSILESLWFGVPIATWPLFAEHQMNAFKMVTELGLAVEVKMDFKFGFGQGNSEFVRAEVIEAAIVKVMDNESEIRKKVKEMSVKCRNSIAQGGSSFSSLDRFVSDVFANFYSQVK